MNAAVRDVMTTEVVAVRREVIFKELEATLRRYRVSALPVVDDMGKVLGVVSEADLLAKKVLADPGVFAELMHSKPGVLSNDRRHRHRSQGRFMTTERTAIHLTRSVSALAG